MDRESLDRLRFDRRLQNRRGWLAPGELESHVEALPDVSDKLTTLADQEAAGASASTAGAEGDAQGQ
ncbi:MAG: hypothetical protein R3F21_11420 [Myxococcota bacterium]